MLTRSWLTSVAAGLLTASPLWAQSVLLQEAPLDQRCVRNEVTLDLQGKQTVKQDSGDNANQKKDTEYPIRLQARHVFLERYLDINGPVADKAARYYTTAEATIRFNNDEGTKRTLRPEHNLIVAQRIKDQVVCFSPDKGTLTREEIELADHFDTMAVSGLIPGKEVALGKSWQLPNHVVLAMCGLNGLTEHNVEGSLVAVKGAIAHVTLVGKLKGIDMGAQVSMIINGRLEFDTTEKCIVAVEWNQSDDRQQGPISPAMSAEVTIKLKRTPIAEPEELGKFVMPRIPTAATPPSNLTNIQYQDARKRFELQYARDWHVTSPANPFVMRLMERGEFVAQVAISPWKKVDPKNVMSKEDFAVLMAETPGWRAEKEEKTEEITGLPKGQHKVYRVVASGELDGVKSWQYFYLVVSPQGEQLIVTFSMVPQHVQRLGARDLELVREISFPD